MFPTESFSSSGREGESTLALFNASTWQGRVGARQPSALSWHSGLRDSQEGHKDRESTLDYSESNHVYGKQNATFHYIVRQHCSVALGRRRREEADNGILWPSWFLARPFPRD